MERRRKAQHTIATSEQDLKTAQGDLEQNQSSLVRLANSEPAEKYDRCTKRPKTLRA
ncbi:hypothetical protein OH492_26580 [Vibrio chagasii]|nr:hypothetical protein [Vibrio chagasii]